MEALEESAKSVEEAVEIALNKLGLSRSEVEVEVLQEGKGGILGWGGEEAKVKVTPLVTGTDSADNNNIDEIGIEIGPVAEEAREVVEELLSLLQIPATMEVTRTDGSQSSLTIDIAGSDLGILIGRRGQTLAALQYLVNFITSRKLKSNVRVIVDVAGYRKRRHEELQNLALRVAELVKSSKRSITLEPMSAMERRVIHLAVRNDPGVTTQSMGFGDSRKVVVFPKRQDWD